MLIYDSHCHLAALSSDLRHYPVAVPAITLADVENLASYRRQNPLAKIGCGIHPWYLENRSENLKEKLTLAIENLQADFIGETGLDATKPYFAAQLESLAIHLELASKFKLPIVLHCVRAYNPLLNILSKFPAVKGVVHAFNGNRQLAGQLAKKGMLLGIGSILLNPDSQLTKSAAGFALEQLLLESDAPYMAAPGKTIATSSDCLLYAQRLAGLQQKSLMTIINEANRNWERLFMRTASASI